MRKEKQLFSIENEQQLDRIRKPLVAFYSPKKTIQSLLALPEVKEDLRGMIREGKEIKISRAYGSFECNVHDIKGDGWDKDLSSYEGRGLEMLDKGLTSMTYYDTGKYDWMWIPPAAGAAGGFIVGGIAGYINGVLAEGTYGAVEKIQWILGLEGGGIGLTGGLIFDLAVGGYTAVKDKIEEPIKRVGLAKKVQRGINYQG